MKTALNGEKFVLGSKYDLVLSKRIAWKFKIYDLYFAYKDV